MLLKLMLMASIKHQFGIQHVKAARALTCMDDNIGYTERVGRWMSQGEYDEMVRTGYVQESISGTTHVARPADITAYMKQAKPGSLYVEFNVEPSTLVNTGNGWAKIIGPNSLQGRFAAMKGLPIPQMPKAYDILLMAVRI